MTRDIKPRQATLHSGEVVSIRAQQVTDAKSLVDFYASLSEEERCVLDDDVSDPNWITRFIRRSNFDTVIPIVAEADGAICGHAWLVRTHYGWMQHVGQLRVAVAPSHQRQGLGSILLKEILRIAVDVGLEMMTARVMETQVGALKMFERVGFRREAIFRGFVKDTYGRRRNMIVLGNDISQIWRAMEALVADVPPTREMLAG